MTVLFWTTGILSILIIFFLIYNYSGNITEGWENYEERPFGYVGTGSNPLSFYRKDYFRKPYNWPYVFYKSYPLPSMQPTMLL